MGERRCRLGLIQVKCVADPDLNRARTLAGIRQAAERGAQVVCTQELYASQYFCQLEEPGRFASAETIPGPTTERLQAEAEDLGVVIVASLFERRAAGLYYNTAVVIDADGRFLGRYRKVHVPDDPGYREKYYFAPGDLGFRIWRTRFADLGVLICWDQWFPEAARLTALQGAEVLFYPSAIGWLPQEKAAHGQIQLEAWETIQRSHAVANGCYVAAVNRVGFEDPQGTGGIEFWGRSFVAGTSGEILARASVIEEETLLADIDRDKIDQTRVDWPFLRDRRIDAYQGLDRPYLDT